MDNKTTKKKTTKKKAVSKKTNSENSVSEPKESFATVSEDSSVEIVNEDETWLSPPDIKNPHGMPDVSTFQSIKDSVSFLINQVLCRPEEINSFLSHRLNRDLMYGFTTASKAGIYANDSSMISDGNNAKTSFDFQKAYSYMLSLRNEINYYEQKRAEAFGIL